MEEFIRLSRAGLESIDALSIIHKQELAALEKEIDADLHLLEAKILINKEVNSALWSKERINSQVKEIKDKVNTVIARQEQEMQECSDKYLKEIEGIKFITGE